MLKLRQTLETARTVLTEANIDFALIGGFALSAHGILRATMDIDLLVDGAHQKKVKQLFLDKNFVVRFETTELLQLGGPGLIDIIFAHRPLSLEMLQFAKLEKKLVGVSVVSREGIIGLKIQAYKNDPRRTLQDKADIQSLLRQEKINLKKVKQYADLFNAWLEIEELLK